MLQGLRESPGQGELLSGLIETTGLVPSFFCKAEWEESSRNMPADICLEAAALSPAPAPVLTLKLVNSVPPFMYLSLFELLLLHWSPE